MGPCPSEHGLAEEGGAGVSCSLFPCTSTMNRHRRQRFNIPALQESIPLQERPGCSSLRSPGSLPTNTSP